MVVWGSCWRRIRNQPVWIMSGTKYNKKAKIELYCIKIQFNTIFTLTQLALLINYWVPIDSSIYVIGNGDGPNLCDDSCVKRGNQSEAVYFIDELIKILNTSILECFAHIVMSSV